MNAEIDGASRLISPSTLGKERLPEARCLPEIELFVRRGAEALLTVAPRLHMSHQLD